MRSRTAASRAAMAALVAHVEPTPLTPGATSRPPAGGRSVSLHAADRSRWSRCPPPSLDEAPSLALERRRRRPCPGALRWRRRPGPPRRRPGAPRAGRRCSTTRSCRVRPVESLSTTATAVRTLVRAPGTSRREEGERRAPTSVGLPRTSPSRTTMVSAPEDPAGAARGRPAGPPPAAFVPGQTPGERDPGPRPAASLLGHDPGGIQTSKGTPARCQQVAAPGRPAGEDQRQGQRLGHAQRGTEIPGGAPARPPSRLR